MYFYKEEHDDYDPFYNHIENEFAKEFEEKEKFLQIGDFSTDPDDFEKKNSENKENENIDMDCSIPIEPLILPEKKEEKNESIFLTIPVEQIKKLTNEGKDSFEKKKEDISKSFLSNKTKSINENSFNNKYKDDNIRRKCKHLVLNSISDFINNKIIELYNNKIGKGIFKKQLQALNKKQKSESNIKFNQEFLNRTIKDIFSDDISGRISNYPKDFNKQLIECLLNEDDFCKKDYFNDLFNLTFIQCLEHYIGANFYYELKGMRMFKDEINNYIDDDENYVRNLEYYLRNYECIINNKKARKKKYDTKS